MAHKYTLVLTGTHPTIWGGYPPDDRRWTVRLLVSDEMPKRGTPDREAYDNTVEIRNLLLNAHNGCYAVTFRYAGYEHINVRVVNMVVERVPEGYEEGLV